ncbi:MAG TPA: site-specific integrase [Vicinamibacterales bacterium]|jgi:integrase|nr:site-specific integrase [Vicinamibacterales bacterium]
MLSSCMVRRRAFCAPFEASQFLAVRSHLAEELRGIVTLAYLTGWRVKSEILPLEWSQVDRDRQTTELRRYTTKNDAPRILPYRLLPELVTVIDAAWQAHEALKAREVICPYVFQRDGEPVRDFRDAWQRACVKAGCPGMLVHDMRRTAVRNLVRAGVPEKIAMSVTGHKTPSVFARYNIVSTDDLELALGKLAGQPVAAATTAQVVQLRKRRTATK